MSFLSPEMSHEAVTVAFTCSLGKVLELLMVFSNNWKK